MDEIASLDWDIVAKKEEGFEPEMVKEACSEVKKFFNNPNSNGETFQTLVRTWMKDILELDAAIIVKVFDLNSYDFDQLEPKSGAPLLKPLGQRRMTEIYIRDGASFLKEIDKFGFNRGYWQYSYQIPAHPMWFERDEIVYCSEHPRSMSCYGFARTQAILDIIKSLHYSTLYNKRFFEETAIPDGALSVLDTNEAEMKDFMAYWNNEFKAQPHKVAVFNKDMKWQPFQISNRELEFLKTQKWYFNMVVSMFGLTPTELGVTEDANRATSATQSELVKRKGIRPFLKLFESFINQGILPEFQYEGIKFQFIYDDPAEKKLRLDNWQMELNMGVKTVNEVRNELGLEPIDGGDRSNSMMDRMTAFGNEQGKEEGGEQGSGFQGEKDRAEGKGEKKEEKKKAEKSVKPATTEEVDQEVRQSILEPYSPLARPIGNFKTMKADYKVMSYDELIAEHKKLVAILEGGDPEKIKEEAREQKKELEQYIEEAKKGIKKEGYVAPVGAYYNDQPLSQPRRPSGAHFQPQNPPPTAPDTSPAQIGSDFRRPTIDTYEGETIVCPMCRRATLAFLNSMETDIQDDVRCTACGARFKADDLVNAKLMEEMYNVMTASNHIEPVSIPAIKPKAATENFNKKYDDDMTVKEYVGFDTSKSLQFAASYANSPRYRKLMRQYFGEMSAEKRQLIIDILKNGLAGAQSMSEISNKLNLVLEDKPRADLIARTEMVRLGNEGNLMRMEEKGQDFVEFISAPEDGRLCEECKKNDGKIFKLEDAKGVLPIHPRCRCMFTEKSKFS